MHEHEEVQHEFKTVQALRGRESSAKSKWQEQGWELISENRGTLRTELSFRRVKPKTFGAHLMGFLAAFRRLRPRTQAAVIASCSLILVTGIIGIVAGTRGGGDTRDPNPAQTTAPAEPPAEPPADPPAEPAATDITVDDLVARLNSSGLGGIEVGDRFRLTGELVGSEFWTTGASGHFFVMLKTEEGSDLEVFIDESATNGWQDGAKVEMVVKMIEATINGETTAGWLEAQSAEIVA